MGWVTELSTNAGAVTIVLTACGAVISAVGGLYLYIKSKLVAPFQEGVQHLRLIPGIEERLAATDTWGLILASSLKIGKFQSDANGKTTSVNSAICRLTHRAESEFLGSNWQNVIHPDDQEPIIDGWRNAIQERRTFEAAYRWLRSDGAPIHVRVHAAPHFGSDGRLLGFQAVVRPCEPDEE